MRPTTTDPSFRILAESLMMLEQAFPKAPFPPDSRSKAARSEPGPAPRARARTRLLVVDDKGVMRDGLCALLTYMPEVEVVGSASIGSEALRSAAALQPDVVIIDFPQTALNGPQLITSLKTELPLVRVVVLTFHREDHLIEGALRAGADGYVLKTDSRDELFNAVTSVAAGKGFISPSLYGRVVRAYVGSPTGERPRGHSPAALTERERQVIRLIAEGHRTREIAQLLSLSHKTIEKHRTSLMRKLGLRNASAVAAYAIAHGFTDG